MVKSEPAPKTRPDLQKYFVVKNFIFYRAIVVRELRETDTPLNTCPNVELVDESNNIYIFGVEAFDTFEEASTQANKVRNRHIRRLREELNEYQTLEIEVNEEL